MGQVVHDNTAVQNADSASLCEPDRLLFREESDERAFAHLSRTKMRKKDGVIEGKRLSVCVWGGKVPGRRQYIHVLAEIGGKGAYRWRTEMR